MKLQSESLTEEFWVCTNSRCNKWLRRSTVINDSDKTAAFASQLFGMAGGIFAIFNKTIFKPSLATMKFDRGESKRKSSRLQPGTKSRKNWQR